jgi:hypothetical protein
MKFFDKAALHANKLIRIKRDIVWCSNSNIESGFGKNSICLLVKVEPFGMFTTRIDCISKKFYFNSGNAIDGCLLYLFSNDTYITFFALKEDVEFLK